MYFNCEILTIHILIAYICENESSEKFHEKNQLVLIYWEQLNFEIDF